jgi:hypothetical protein
MRALLASAVIVAILGCSRPGRANGAPAPSDGGSTRVETTTRGGAGSESAPAPTTQSPRMACVRDEECALTKVGESCCAACLTRAIHASDLEKLEAHCSRVRVICPEVPCTPQRSRAPRAACRDRKCTVEWITLE